MFILTAVIDPDFFMLCLQSHRLRIMCKMEDFVERNKKSHILNVMVCTWVSCDRTSTLVN